MNILVVEDDEITARAIERYLVHDGFTVTLAADGTVALEAAQRERPQLVVLDVMLPGMDGFNVCRKLREYSSVPIIMLTARTTEDDTLAGLEAGADDYITKPFSLREVVARVKTVLRRAYAPGGDGQLLAIGDLLIDRNARSVRANGSLIALTPTEFRIVEALAVDAGTVLTRSRLVERAFGHDYEGLERTIDVHVRNLRKKLEAANAHASCIRTVFGVGYVFEKTRAR